MAEAEPKRISKPISRGDVFMSKMVQLASHSRRSQCFLVPLFYSLLLIAFFSPALFVGHLLAIGADGQNLYLPNYYSTKTLWDTLLFAGFPMKADPQVMSWYPPAMLLSMFPGTWNLFILFGYVAASSFTHGYIYTLTLSHRAALFSGVIFCFSGFMMAHLGHAVIIHSVAWIPLVIWALEQLRRRQSVGWLISGSVGIALSFLGGHSQIFTYGFIVAVAYSMVLGWTAPVGRWRYYVVSSTMILLGLGLAAIQIIPTAEIVGHSVREEYKFSDFVSHSLPPRQTLLLIFPRIFGGPEESGGPPYFGADNQTELTGYAGLLPLMLAAFGLMKSTRKSLSLFWICVAMFALVLAMGDATPLARLTYHVPFLNQFRAPARHLFETTFAITVLAGLGIDRLIRQEPSNALIFRVILFSGSVILICILIVLTDLEAFVTLAAQQNILRSDALSWIRKALVVAAVIFVLSASILSYWIKRPISLWRNFLLFVILLIDLGSFGWFYQWRYASLDEQQLERPAIAVRYKSVLADLNQRLLPTNGTFAETSEMPPNLSRLWEVPSASGYNSLILSRFSRLLALSDVGVVTAPLWWEPNDQSLDLTSIRYIFVPRGEIVTDGLATRWHKDNMQLWLGSGCNQPDRPSITFNLPAPVMSTEVAIVARLACSSQIPDDTAVARVRLEDADGYKEIHSLLAGQDVSEWAYDCKSVIAHMKHRRAEIYSSYQAEMYEESCSGHFYVTRLKLDKASDLSRVSIEWIDNSGSMILEKITLIDSLPSQSTPINPIWMSPRWRLVEETEAALVFENLAAMPRAWLVPEVVTVDPAQALAVIRTARLPDGRIFSPEQMALVEASVPMVPQPKAQRGTVKIVHLSDTQMELHTSSSKSDFLVTSDVYYPGWRATVDGNETRIYRTNYAFRGVFLPGGDHVVRFEYRPSSYFLGVFVSVLSLFLLAAIGLKQVLVRRSI